jgi:hypothetical protein
VNVEVGEVALTWRDQKHHWHAALQACVETFAGPDPGSLVADAKMLPPFLWARQHHAMASQVLVLVEQARWWNWVVKIVGELVPQT